VEVLQGIRQMRFEGLLGRPMSGSSCRGGNGGDAGVLERPFRRWRDRLGDEGPERLCAIAVSASCRAVTLRQ
jgi:hypothetical protein